MIRFALTEDNAGRMDFGSQKRVKQAVGKLNKQGVGITSKNTDMNFSVEETMNKALIWRIL